MIEKINIYNENNTKYGLKKYNRKARSNIKTKDFVYVSDIGMIPTARMIF